ncbi:MAG TPA: nuclear transport factor 2 family protein [Steroidobacteraceae bacterium]
MMNRLDVEKIVKDLHTARIEGRLDAVCALFASGATFKIAGATDGKPIAITAQGNAEIRTWLAVMLKTFKLARYQPLSVVIEGGRAAAHWRVDIHSKITGVVVPTELVDLLEVSDGRITSYREFFAPC